MKHKLGYIDHSFHEKTKSTYFLRDILTDDFDVIDVWDESWNGGAALTAEKINSFDFEYVLFFQSLLPISELKKIRAKLVWVPMYDGVINLPVLFWKEIASVQIKIISFSSTLTGKMTLEGLDVLPVQYFKDPSLIMPVMDYDSKRIFFWQRTNSVTFKDVKKIIGNQRIDKTILKLDPDPTFKAQNPDPEDVKKYNIEIIDWSDSPGEYLRRVSECNIFISPRKYEGIGMSFIEAMTMGMATIAYDNPTMNEYIRHEKNGYLFSAKKEINLVDIDKIGKSARESCASGHQQWLIDQKKINRFILGKYESAQVFSVFWRVMKLLYLPRSSASRIWQILRKYTVK